MEILLWLVPAAVATTLAMLWAAWAGRETTPTVDEATAAERLGRALRSDRPVRYAPRPAPAYDSGGVAVRPAREPEPEPVVADQPEVGPAEQAPAAAYDAEDTRRAS
jgi:hypothetical protein